MKAMAIAICSVLLMSSCTRMEHYYDDTSLVTIDGREFMVRPLPGREDAWHAVLNRVEGSHLFTADPALSLMNVRAIEKHTGCRVIRETIDNREINTFAAVDCS